MESWNMVIGRFERGVIVQGLLSLFKKEANFKIIANVFAWFPSTK
jgi:hypothetical protein